MTAIESVMTAAIFGNDPGRVTDPIQHSREMLDFVEFPMAETVVADQLNTVQLKTPGPCPCPCQQSQTAVHG